MTGIRKSIKLDSGTISYIQDGDGSNPVLFLHGWGGDALSFQPLFQALRDAGSKSTFYALDFPGFGESAPPPSAWGVDDYAECVVKYLANMHISRPELVIHSFGGRVALKLLARKADIFQRAALIAPAGIKHETRSKETIGFVAKTLKKILSIAPLKPLLPIVRSLGYKSIGAQDYLAAEGVMKESFSRVVDEDLKGCLSSITAPIHIFWGKDDTYVPFSDGEQMQSAMKQAQLTLFNDGRHGIHKTHAAQIAQALIPFLNK
ncbi:MAG: alpha/beta hydrolase [Candidatus Kerfeldbacteria bacterium]